jgi:hypothetical protein
MTSRTASRSPASSPTCPTVSASGSGTQPSRPENAAASALRPWRKRPLRLCQRQWRSPAPQQLRTTGVPARRRRPLPATARAAGQARHRGRGHVARPPSDPVAAPGARNIVQPPEGTRHPADRRPGLTRRMASDPARPHTARLAAQPQHMDDRGRHPRDPPSPAPRPPGPRHAGHLHPRHACHARGAPSGPPGPLGTLPARTRHPRLSLTRRTARQTSGTTAAPGVTGRTPPSESERREEAAS